MSAELTPRQSSVLDFIATHIVKHQRPPTRKVICRHFGWASENAAEDYVKALERKGFLVLEGVEGGSHWKRYPRVIRWPDNVLPIIRLAAEPQPAEA